MIDYIIQVLINYLEPSLWLLQGRKYIPDGRFQYSWKKIQELTLRGHPWRWEEKDGLGDDVELESDLCLAKTRCENVRQRRVGRYP